MNLKNRVVYIAGQITGRMDTYRQEFAEAEKHLADQGAVVLNPAVLPIGLKSHQSYMNICLPMLREAEVLVLLPGWRHSKGAMAEYEEAGRLGIVSYPFQPIATGPLSVDEPANDNVPASDDNWFERRAMPPVGAECEAFADGAPTERCRILGYHRNQIAVQWYEFNGGCLDVLERRGWEFRPISTGRDKADADV